MVLDPAGTPVHTDLSYKCRDRWGMLAETYARMPSAVGRATVRLKEGEDSSGQ